MRSSVEELAGRFGTPLYVYRAPLLRSAVDSLRAALPPPHRLYYSLKANPHPGLVRLLTAMGLHAEVSSTGEMATALAGGQPAGQVLYTGPGKTTREIAEALKAGVRLFSVESVEDHRRLSDVASAHGRQADYLIRVNGPASGAAGRLRMTGRPSQFGVDLGTLRSHPELFAASAAARPVGLHFYPVTNLADPAALGSEIVHSIEVAAALTRQTGLVPSLLDLGGGFAAPFAAPGQAPSYAALRPVLERHLDEHFSGWRHGSPVVAFESGRYLTGGCGTLLTRVQDVKTSGGRTFAVLDAGIHVLGGVSATGRLRPTTAQPLPYPVSAPAGPPPGHQPADGAEAEGARAPDEDRFTLAGPLCTPVDVLNLAVRGAPPRVGEVLAIPNVGAYGLTASVIAFLSRDVPAELLLGDNDEPMTVTTLALRREESQVTDRAPGGRGQAPADVTGT